MKKWFLFLFLILLLSPAYAATIQGTIYDFGLNQVNDSIVGINTEPHQKVLSKNGTYSFEVQEGDYTLIARNGEDIAIEEIQVTSEGIFNLDLFLFPDLHEEADFISADLDINIEEDLTPEWWWLYVLLGLWLASIIFRRFIRKKYPKKELEDLEKRVYDTIKKEKKITQKELRKKFPYSEAKISLILTDLESKNKIKKIKKGRSNIITLI